MNKPTVPAVVLEAARNEHQRLVAAREQAMQAAAAPFDEKIKELVDFLSPFETEAALEDLSKFMTEFESDMTITAQIKQAAQVMIKPGTSVTTQQIHDAMIEQGVKFPTSGKPPLARITRVISGTGLYRGHKVKGWSLRSEETKTESPVQEEIQ